MRRHILLFATAAVALVAASLSQVQAGEPGGLTIGGARDGRADPLSTVLQWECPGCSASICVTLRQGNGQPLIRIISDTGVISESPSPKQFANTTLCTTDAQVVEVQCLSTEVCGYEFRVDVQTVTVTVADTTPPVVTPPASITIEATGSTTAVDLGTASALDLVDGALPATPDVTGPFPIGSTVVTWSATDAAGNTGTATQNVTLVYIFGQFLPPLEDGKIYKADRTLPVKFQITFIGGELVENATVGIEVVSLGVDDTPGEPIDLSTNETADTGSVFRFTNGQYIYNLSTIGFEPGKYRITAILSNGQAPFIDIGLR